MLMLTDRQKKQLYEKFGRTFVLLFSRATMYTVMHPFTVQAQNDFYKTMTEALDQVSPLVFIMNRGQFFIEDEICDPRVNPERMLFHFKKVKIESVSFEKGIKEQELARFLRIFINTQKYPTAEAMSASFNANDVRHIKINHVVFRKMTKEEEIVSRDDLEKVLTDDTASHRREPGKQFLDLVLEDVLIKEFETALSIENLLNDPGGLSGSMIRADRVIVEKSEAPDRGYGPLLVHQLEKMNTEIQKAASNPEEANLYDLAMAVYEMKKELLEGIEEQKAMGIVYLDEAEIIDKAHEITDQVLIQLIKQEYKDNKTSIPRLAQIIRRMIPDSTELRRILPLLKASLIADGMPISEFLELIKEIGKDIQSDELARSLRASAEDMGLDSDTLIKDFKQSPQTAAELIYLAAEIRRSGADETVLSDLLVDYIERIGSELCIDLMADEEDLDDSWLREVISRVQIEIVDRLRLKAIDPDVLNVVEDRLTTRIDSIFEKLKSSLDFDLYGSTGERPGKIKSTLKVLEESVEKEDPLYDILQKVRKRFQQKGLDENNLNEILNEMSSIQIFQEKISKRKEFPRAVLNPQNSIYMLEKEIARAVRYGTPFSMMGLSIVKAIPQQKSQAAKITQESLENALLDRLSVTVRDTDTVGYLGKNKIIVLMPMTHEIYAKMALQRNLKLLHKEHFTINKVPVNMKVAGVTHDFNEQRTPTVQEFLNQFSTELFDMVVRLRNVQGLI